jgi:hypothetical protein
MPAAPSSGRCPGLQQVKYLRVKLRTPSTALRIVPVGGPVTPLPSAPPRLRLFLVLLRYRRVRIVMN